MGAGWQRWWQEDPKAVAVDLVGGREVNLSKLRGWMTIRDVTLYTDGRIESSEPREVYLGPVPQAKAAT